jgi:hypothetical protein
MRNKFVAVFTLFAFLGFETGCVIHNIRQEPADKLAQTSEKGVQIVKVLKKSGEEINFSNDLPARIVDGTIIGEVLDAQGAEMFLKRDDVKEVDKDDRGKIVKLITKGGVKYSIGEGQAITSLKEERDRYVLVYPKKKPIFIPLSEVDLVSIRRTDPLGTFFATVGVIALVGAGVLAVVALLKESCPFIYSFDGQNYVFDAEPYGGATSQGLQRTEWCTLEHLKEVNGQYRIRITNEVDETQNTDELKLLVVDHPRGVQAVPDEQGVVHTIIKPVAPLSARDGKGRDILALVRTEDAKYWQSRIDEKDPDNAADLRDEIVFEFPKPAGATTAKLLFNGCNTLWASQMLKKSLELYGEEVTKCYAAVDSKGPAYANLMAWNLREELYRLHIRAETSEGWTVKGMIVGGGPFISENRVYTLDIRDVPGTVLRIKMLPPAGYWMINALAVDYAEDVSVSAIEIAPAKAVDSRGREIADLLLLTDSRYYTMPKTGDSAEVTFLAPPAIPGMARTVICKASGYYSIHLPAQGKPQMDILSRFLTEPGFAVRYALKEYRRYQQEKSLQIR